MKTELNWLQELEEYIRETGDSFPDMVYRIKDQVENRIKELTNEEEG